MIYRKERKLCDEVKYRESKAERRIKYDRRHKRHMESLVGTTRYPSGVTRVGHDNCWTDDPNETKYLKRWYRGSRSSWLKRMSNKQLRRYKGEVPNRGGYKKVYDYWWELT